MENQFKEQLINYQNNFTNKNHHSSIQNGIKNFEVNQLITFCEKEINSKLFCESDLNNLFIMKLIDYSARTDTYFEEQKNRLLNYSLAIGGFATTYITTIIGLYSNNIISQNLSKTVLGFGVVLLGCVITWIIYILSFSPDYPHRKKSYSPFFFAYNVCSKLTFLCFSFIPKSEAKKEEALKAFHLDLTTYVNRISEMSNNYSEVYKNCLTQVVMLFRTAQHKSKSVNLMRTILSITLTLGLLIYLTFLYRVLI